MVTRSPFFLEYANVKPVSRNPVLVPNGLVSDGMVRSDMNLEDRVTKAGPFVETLDLLHGFSQAETCTCENGHGFPGGSALGGQRKFWLL